MPPQQGEVGRPLEIILPYASRTCANGAVKLAIRPIEGADEIALDEACHTGCSAAAATTLLIGRCASNDNGAIGADEARSLSLGDREVVLCAIYSASFSPRLTAKIDCALCCGAMIEIDVDLERLTEPAGKSGATHVLELDGQQIAFRVPNGRDMEFALGQAEDPGAVLAGLCVEGVPVEPAFLANALLCADPNIERAVSIACPDCGEAFDAYVDGFELVRNALADGGGITADVARLARAYGWTEHDVAALPRRRRLRYCALIGAGARP